MLCKACELSVGAVIGICPYEQPDANEIYVCVGGVEAKRRADSEKYRCYGYGIGMYAETAEKGVPCIAERSLEGEVDMFVGIRRFQSGAIFLLDFFKHGSGELF